MVNRKQQEQLTKYLLLLIPKSVILTPDGCAWLEMSLTLDGAAKLVKRLTLDGAEKIEEEKTCSGCKCKTCAGRKYKYNKCNLQTVKSGWNLEGGAAGAADTAPAALHSQVGLQGEWGAAGAADKAPAAPHSLAGWLRWKCKLPNNK